MVKLDIKKNRNGSLVALYCNRVRVGYVQRSDKAADRYVWTLNVMQPEGGVANGICASFDLAKDSADAAFEEWLTAAGLYRF